MPPNDRSRPGKDGFQNAAGSESSTFTTLPGRMIALEIELRGIGRVIELIPDAWPLAQRAFRAASAVRHIRGQVFS